MRKKKRVFKRYTLRVSLWEYREIQELKKETFSKTASKAILKAATNYVKLKRIIYDLQNELDILKHEQTQQRR